MTLSTGKTTTSYDKDDFAHMHVNVRFFSPVNVNMCHLLLDSVAKYLQGMFRAIGVP